MKRVSCWKEITGACHGDYIFTKAQDILLDDLFHVFSDCLKGESPVKVFLRDEPWRCVAPLLVRRWRGSAIRKLSLKLVETGTSVVFSILYVVFYSVDVFLLTLNNSAKLLKQKNGIEVRKVLFRLELIS